VLSESFAGEGARAIENGALEIVLQGDFAALEGGDQHFVAALEFDVIEIELFEGLLALLVVPRVAEQDAADIPEKSGDFGQEDPPEFD
jgi:hypothetical protein